MKKPVSHSFSHVRALSLFAVAGALGLAAIGLTQCRMVSDNVAGVDMTTESLHSRNTCVRECNSDFQDAMAKEDCRHREALRTCGFDRACRESEKRKHHDIEAAIREARKECKKKCYNEGQGGGGR